MKKIIVILMLLFPMITGCSSIITLITNPLIDSGVQAYLTWKDGEATAYYACDSNTAYNAIKAVLFDLHYTIESDKPDAKGSYVIMAKSHNTFKITIHKTEDYVTAIKIRVDTMGDKPYAEMIYKKLERQLDVIDFTQRKARWRLFGN